MATLTKDLIVQRTQKRDLNLIKNLNLWGNNLTNVDALLDLPNLEVLSLSVNNLTTLAPLRHLTCLQELYVRRNNISDLKELAYLTRLKRLKILWLGDNPISRDPDYRKTILAYCPFLRKIDNKDVTPDELSAALKSPIAIAIQTQHISKKKVEDSKGINSCERTPSRSNSLSAADLLVQKESAVEPTNTSVEIKTISRFNSTENLKRSRSSWSIRDFDEVNSSIRAASKTKDSSNSALNLENSIKASPPSAKLDRSEDVNSEDKSTSKADKSTLMEERTVRPMSSGVHPSSSVVQKETRRSTTSPNVLIAVLALLKELDHDGLSIVQRETSNALLK